MTHKAEKRHVCRSPICAGFSGYDSAVFVASRQDIVFVRFWRIGPLSRHHFAFFIQENRGITNFRMQIGKARSNHHALGIVPRTIANSVFGVNGLIIRAFFDAQISVPGFTTNTRSRRQVLAPLIRSRKAPQIARRAASARYEEAHGLPTSTASSTSIAAAARSSALTRGAALTSSATLALASRARFAAATAARSAAAARGTRRRRLAAAIGQQ